MGLIGAALGAIFGSRFGLVGSLAGSVLGSSLGDALARKITEAREQQGTSSRARTSIENELLFLTALGAMFAKLSKADGHVDATEIAAGERAFVRLGLTPEKREIVIRAFRTAKLDEHSIYDYAASFASVTQARALRELVYDLLWDIACADGVLAPEECEILTFITAPLNIRSALFSAEYQRRIGTWQDSYAGAGDHGRSQQESCGTSSAPDPYEILGCSRTASDDEVRRAYRAQAKKLHPDVLRAQGLPEELISKANEQMARINAAWSEIKRARGL